MKQLIFVPIEPIESRYSTQWNDWFQCYFISQSMCYLIVNADPSLAGGKINQGQFLDVIGTNHYKAPQLQSLCNLIHNGHITDGDVIFFEDYWFPGIEMLFYIRDGAGIDFKITGMLHAGTWDKYDFLSKQHMGLWARGIEFAWLKQADALFVATHFHKALIEKYFAVPFDNIRITGFPIYSSISSHSATRAGFKVNRFDSVLDIVKNTIVFPHRLAPEKNPDRFDHFIQQLSKDFKQIKTASEGGMKSKESYYDLLGISSFALSFANQETWGIAMQEAVLCGCIPIVPNRLSYIELYPNIFRYKIKPDEPSYDSYSARVMFNQLLESNQQMKITDSMHALQHSILIKGESAIPNMMGHLMLL